MEKKPGVLELISQAKNFVQDNFGYLWNMVKPLLVYILIFEFLAYFIGKYSDIGSIFSIPTIYFVACFALIWHRSVLQGPSSSHAVKPFELKDEDKPFLWLFFGLTFLYVLMGQIAQMILKPSVLFGLGGILIVTTIIMLISFWIAVELARFFGFMLPAKSVNAKTSIKISRTLSKGLAWKLVLAVSILAIIFFIFFIIYRAVIGDLLAILFSGMGEGPILYVIRFISMSPMIFASIILTAVNVTMLSKMYQWGVVHQSGEEAGK